MALDLSTCKLLTMNVKKNFLGDNLFYFQKQTDLTFRGTFWEYNETGGVGKIWTDISNFLAGASDYSTITANGISFGNGKITNITFPEGTDVKSKDWTVDITVLTTGNLFNLTGAYYNGIDTSNFYKLDSLSETLSFNQDNIAESRYEHNISLRFNSGVGLDPVAMAKSVASSMFNNSDLAGFLGSFTGGRPRYFERYNLQNSECSFTKTTEYNTLSSNYSILYTNAIETNEAGITTVNENGQIRGMAHPFSGAAQAGLITELAAAYGRCNTIFGAYGNGNTLRNLPISKNVDINTFAGEINYQIAFSNDLAENASFRHEYTRELNRRDNGIYEVSENGILIGYGRQRGDKLTNAFAGYTSNVSGIIVGARLTGLYTTHVASPSTLYPISKSLGIDAINANLNYTEVFTDDNTLAASNGIRKKEIRYEDSFPTPLVNIFPIGNVKELVQNVAYVPTVSRRNLSLNLIGARTLTLNSYVTEAKSIAADYVPDWDFDVILAECNYSFNSGQNQFNFNAEWNAFSGGASFADISNINL